MALTCFATVLVAACFKATAPTPKLAFLMDAPLCSGGAWALRFEIDGAVAGTAALMHGQRSEAFIVKPGPRQVRVIWLRQIPPSSDPVSQQLQDTIVHALPEATVVDTIGFYCS